MTAIDSPGAEVAPTVVIRDDTRTREGFLALTTRTSRDP
jgi:hypothetical protein